MEIESLRLDFQTLIITKPQNNSRAYQRRKKKKKKKKNQKNLGSVRALGYALPGSRDPGRVRVLKKKKKKNTLAIRKNSLKKEKKRKEKPNNIATLDRPDRKSTRLNSSHSDLSRMPSSA